ncbi:MULTISPECIES: hypothetical protein [Ignavibacterium]|jgi:sRNA-binding regulator protein Hfq/small nuclear ribonucleoprotein (snRNP)-like protein|uniref:hypothetical protein n=1 Tax=Ignavibacterium TaxID=795750 RepID=UPI0025BF5BE0|nr:MULTISPECIES: hypothetical protein [Ignavibacterium]MBI5661761.1 hypothetical protein [Ignavibacterium album]
MRFKFLVILFLTINVGVNTFAQDVSVVLKNSKVVAGRLVEEKPEHIVLITDTGELKIERGNIQTITFNPFTEINPSNSDDEYEKLVRGHKFTLKDPVVVYFRNGNVVSGMLLAKSLDMVMLQTESGNLTVNKKDIQKIEYISSEYAERGEIVVAHLTNGQRYQGNIYFEDSNELTLDTELGRLSIPKNKLRMLEYTGRKGTPQFTLVDQYIAATDIKRYLQPRYDVIDAGYTTKFGTIYGPGFGLGYQSRFTIEQFESVYLSAVGGLAFNYFGLNEENIIQRNPNITANLRGGAFITTINAGGQLNIYPRTSSFYDLYISPVLEGHLIYKSLDQEYPSFPQFNSSEKSTDFKFGIGIRFGAEFLFDSFSIGVHYNNHIIFGADGFNQFSVTFVKTLF